MKKTLYLTCSLLLNIFFCTAQETTQPVHNKSNRIILHFDDTTGVFTQLGRIFIDRGYDIDFKDRDLGILRTKPRVWYSNFFSYAEIKSIFRDSTVTLYSETNSRNFIFEVRYTRKKGDKTNSAWAEMMKIAEMLKPKSITYSRFEADIDL